MRRIFVGVLVWGLVLQVPGAGVQAFGVDGQIGPAGGGAAGLERQVNRALQVYGPALSGQPEGALCRTGFVRLLSGDTAGALAAFQEALSQQEGFAPAHYGMALASFLAGQDAHQAGAFAQQTRYHAERAATLHPDFEGPYRLLGRVHLEVLEDFDRAVDAYVRSLEVEPTADPEVLRRTAEAYIGTGALPDMAAADSLRGAGTEVLPVVAQACLDRKSPDLAAQYFGRYLASLAAEERRLYQDIGLIGSEAEVEACERTAGDAAGRREFLARFWAGRDPDLITGVNERQLEHYRRVWFARTNFSGSAYPWDRRGEVYIRYGPPDYRSRSGRPALPMSAAVERVKERLAAELYGEEGPGEVSAGPTFPILVQVDPGMNFSDVPPPDMQTGEGPLPDAVASDPVLSQEALPPEVQAAQRGEIPYEVRLAQPYGRVGGAEDMTFTRWESWVYTGVAGGIELVFTDPMGAGRFEYAPVPPPDPDRTDAVSRMGRLVRYSPQMVMERSIAQMPEYYLPGGQEEFLEFYYDRAVFRGRDGKTRVEVYYGMSPEHLTTTVRGDTAFVYVGCATRALDPVSGDVFQVQEDALYRASGGLAGARGAFIPHQLTLEVAPGEYALRVQVKDLVSGRSGIYKEHLEVEDYGGPGLSMSDLQMGWKVLSEGGPEIYRKGDVWVVPMTTKAYRKEQNPFVYYEVYNLSRDRFGQTRFRLDYTIQYEPERGGGLGRFVASVGRALGRERRPEVSVSAEQVRGETDLREYFELNLQKNVRSGVNRLTVSVMDLNSGAAVQKEVLFRYE